MIMNLSGFESNAQGRDASSAGARLQSSDRIEAAHDSQQSFMSPVLVEKKTADLQCYGPKAIGTCKSTDACALSPEPPLAPPTESPGALEARHRIKRISAPNSLSPTAPQNFQRISTSTTSSQLHYIPTESGSKKRTPDHLSKTSSKAMKQELAVPLIYKLARKCMWDEFQRCLKTASQSDLNFVYSKDGTTIMHMVVMSRSGYINAFKSSSSKRFELAPDGLLEHLLLLCPQLARVQCSLNGYTPLTYACLVCDESYRVETAAAMVRLFLDHVPDSIYLFTKDGLSPVDIHVVSYSHHHPDKEDKSSLGRSSATVLRALLSHSPELACNRLQGDKITGPIELLYKCNSKAFSQAALDEIHNVAEEGTVHSEFTLPERRQKVVDEVKRWWIWTWTVLLLRYASDKQRKRGTQFSVVHAAASQVGCPGALIKLALFAFPRQVKLPILETCDLLNFPLHAVCSWKSQSSGKSPAQSLFVTRKAQAIAILIEEYPMAASMANDRGEFPLEIAARSQTTWDGGIRRLVKAYPKALRISAATTGLLPFMTAAIAPTKQSTSSQNHLQSVRTVYSLLRSNPKVLDFLQSTQQKD